MNLWLRLLWLAVAARFRSRCDPVGPCRTPFRVLPTDLDLLRHVNNGVYFSIMDVARVDLMARSGMLAALRARGWYPVVVAETIQFRRPLTLFQRFEIETRVLGWDDRAFHLQQRFIRRQRGGDEDAVATAVVSGRFLSREGTLAPAAVLAAVGETRPSPALPEWVARWVADQSAWRR